MKMTVLNPIDFQKVNVGDNIAWGCGLQTSSHFSCRSHVFEYSLTSPYRHLYNGHLSITDSSFAPRKAKNHTFPTSIIRTPL